MSDNERYDPVEEAMAVAQRATAEAEQRHYPVSLRVHTAAALDEYLLTSKGLYHFPDKGDSFWSDPKYNRVLTVVGKVREGLTIDSQFGHPLKSEDPQERTTVHLQEADMDIINGLIVGDIDLNREFSAEWWVQGDSRVHSDEAYETAVTEWREGGLSANSRSLAMLRELNTAFLAAGAAPRSGFTRFFDLPQ